MILLIATIIGKRMLTKTIVELTLRLPKGYPEVKPGQFVRVECKGVLIPRPISICWSDICEDPKICLVVEARGQGTEWLIKRRKNSKLKISEPIGNGFIISPQKKYLFVGGGIGVPPLFSAYMKVDDYDADAILCFSTAKKVILEDYFKLSENQVIVATDDGTYGQHGRADEILREFLSNSQTQYEAIMACGPKPMLAAIAKIAKERGITCYVSLEERMVCGGVNVCKGCAVKLRDIKGKTRMGTVCHDGPVFNAEEVVW